MPAPSDLTFYELLASDRFRAAWARLDASEHGDRMAAFEGVRRLVAASDGNLEKLLEHAIAGAKAAVEAERARTRRDASMDDAFSGIFPETFGQSRQPPPQARNLSGKPIMQGRDIPAQVIGRVTIRERRYLPRGTMLVVSVEGSDRVYEPLVVFDPVTIEMIQTAEDNGIAIRAAVQHSNDPPHNGKIVSLRIMPGVSP